MCRTRKRPRGAGEARKTWLTENVEGDWETCGASRAGDGGARVRVTRFKRHEDRHELER